MDLGVEVAGRTDVGCKRTNNEDNLGYDTRYGIFVVCDGMGGQAAGEVASKMAVDTMLTYFRTGSADGVFPLVGTPREDVSEHANRLASAIYLANTAIHEGATQHAAQAGMGSTIVAVLLHDGFFSIGHVGDSRIYLIRQGEIQQLTQDHSLVMEQVRRGLITREQAATSDMQNIIIRALGTEETVQPDLDDLMAMPGDVLVMVSDGLTRHVSDEEILSTITSSASLRFACDSLVEAARDAGGEDNITVLLLRVVELSWYKKWLRRFTSREDQWQNSV
jgi:serine/threonine protein phosphatase PrpC